MVQWPHVCYAVLVGHIRAPSHFWPVVEVWERMLLTDTCVAVMQVGFGSGFKCNSAVWKATRNIHDTRHAAWAHLMKPGNLEKAWQYVQVCATSTHAAWLLAKLVLYPW